MPTPPWVAVAEEDFLADVRNVATLNGWRIHHTRRSRGSDKGLPDLILLRPPRLVFAELKVHRRKLTSEQDAWLDDLAAVPCVEAYEWRPDEWDEILSVLRRR